MRAADEVVEFLAREIPAAALTGFRPSETTRQRVWELVRKEKEDGLTPEEKCELDDYERLEHLLILAKAKARTQAAHGCGDQSSLAPHGGRPGELAVRVLSDARS